MDVTVGGISCKFAQRQSERGAQDDKVNTQPMKRLFAHPGVCEFVSAAAAWGPSKLDRFIAIPSR